MCFTLSRIHDISVVYARKQASKKVMAAVYPSQSPYQRETQGRRQWRCRICVVSRKGVCRRDGLTTHRNPSRIAIPHQGSIGDSRSLSISLYHCVLLPGLKKDHTAPLAFMCLRTRRGRESRDHWRLNPAWLTRRAGRVRVFCCLVAGMEVAGR